MVNYDKFDRIVEEDEAEDLNNMVKTTNAVVATYKELGKKSFASGDLAEAVGQYTSCIVLLTGERDPRVKNDKVMVPKEPPKKQPEAEKPKKKEPDMSGIDMPKGVQAIDPSQVQQQQGEPEDPNDGFGKSHEVAYVDDSEIAMRSQRAALLLHASKDLREMLANVSHNRALCSLMLSEGKQKAYKEKITSSPGGVDKWDNYRVRMTADALNDCKRAVQMDPTHHKAWYRIGYATYRLIHLIDRMRERKAWLREEELPILDKPGHWEEARFALNQALEILKRDVEGNKAQIRLVHEKLSEIYDMNNRMTCIVRKLGHENLQVELNKSTFVLESVDDGGPSKKWGVEHFVGCRLTHLKVGDDGPLLPVADFADLVKRQTHASYCTLGFAPKEPLPPLPSVHSLLGEPEPEAVPERPVEATQAPAAVEHVRKDPSSAERWGPPPPRRVPKPRALVAVPTPMLLAVVALLLSVMYALAA